MGESTSQAPYVYLEPVERLVHAVARLTPKRKVVADGIRARIEAGEWRAGQRLPTYEELQKQYEASAPAIAQAMLDLVDVVHSKKRSGCYVRPKSVQTGAGMSIKNVGLLISDPLQGNSVHSFAQAFIEEAGRLQLNPIIHFSYRDAQKESEIVARVTPDVDALVAFPVSSKYSEEAYLKYHLTGRPLVFVDRIPNGFPNSMCVRFNEYKAGELAAECILGAFSKEAEKCAGIFFVTNSDRATNVERLQGVRMAARKAGVHCERVREQHPEPRMAGRKLAKDVIQKVDALSSRGGIDSRVGVIAAYDDIAEGVLETLFALGRPFRLVSFDNSVIAQDFKIASVRRHPGDLARAALRQVMHGAPGDIQEPELITKGRITHKANWNRDLRQYWIKAELTEPPLPPSSTPPGT